MKARARKPTAAANSVPRSAPRATGSAPRATPGPGTTASAPTTVWLAERTARGLAAMARATGRTPSELAAMAIASMLSVDPAARRAMHLAPLPATTPPWPKDAR